MLIFQCKRELSYDVMRVRRNDNELRAKLQAGDKQISTTFLTNSVVK